MEEPGAPMQIDSAEVTEAAPLTTTLDAEQQIQVPLKNTVASPSVKRATASRDESEDDAAEKSDQAGVMSDERAVTEDASTPASKLTDKENIDRGEKSPVPALSSAAASGEVDYADWDFEPPLANIRRLLKPILSKGTNISKDSVTALSRAAGIFVLYLSNCATDIAREGKRSTITGKDIMKALKELDLEDFIPQLEEFMIEHKKYEKKRKAEKDRSKMLKTDGSSVSVKKGVRGSDGKYVGVSPAEDAKEEYQDDSDDDKPEETLASQIINALSAKHGTANEDRHADEVKRRKLEHNGESSD